MQAAALLPSLGTNIELDVTCLPTELSAVQWATFLQHTRWLDVFGDALNLQGKWPAMGSDEAVKVIEHFSKIYDSFGEQQQQLKIEITGCLRAAVGSGSLSCDSPLALLRVRLTSRAVEGLGSLAPDELQSLLPEVPRCAWLPLHQQTTPCAALHLLVCLLADQWRLSKDNARQALLGVVKQLLAGSSAMADIVRTITDSILSIAVLPPECAGTKQHGGGDAQTHFATLLLVALCECRHQSLEATAAHFCSATLSSCSAVFECLLDATTCTDLQRQKWMDRFLYCILPTVISQFGFEWCWSGWQRTLRRHVNANSGDRHHAEAVMRTLLRECYRRSYQSRMQQVLPTSLQTQFLDDIAADALETFSMTSTHPCPEGALTVMNFLGRSGARTAASEFKDAVEGAVSVTPQFIQLAASAGVDPKEKSMLMARMRLTAALSAIVLLTQGRRRSQFQSMLEMADPVLASYLVTAGETSSSSGDEGYNAFLDVARVVGCSNRNEVTRRYLEMLETLYLTVNMKKKSISTTVSSADFLRVMDVCLDASWKRLYGTGAVELGWARHLLSRLRARVLFLSSPEGKKLLTSDDDHKLLLDFELKHLENISAN